MYLFADSGARPENGKILGQVAVLYLMGLKLPERKVLG